MTKTIKIDDSYRRIYTLKRHAAKRRMIEMIKQRMFGLLILSLCAVIVLVAAGGQLPEGGDITAILLFAPVGIYALFTKEYIM